MTTVEMPFLGDLRSRNSEEETLYVCLQRRRPERGKKLQGEEGGNWGNQVIIYKQEEVGSWLG